MFWFGAAVALCYIPGLTGAYIATQWPLLSLALPFFLLREGKFTVFHALGLAFVAYAAVRLPFSPVPYASVFGLWLVVIMALCVWFGSVAVNMRDLYAGLAAGAAADCGSIATSKHDADRFTSTLPRAMLPVCGWWY